MYSLICTDDVPVEKRFEFWCETVAAALMPLDISSPERGNFHAGMRVLDFGPIRLSRAHCAPFRAHRTPQTISRFDPGELHLALSVHGNLGIAQNGREVMLRPTDMVLYHSSRPFQTWVPPQRWHKCSAGRRTVDVMTLQLAPELLALPAAAVEQVLMRRFSGTDGLGVLLYGLLNDSINQGAQFRPSDSSRVAALIIELVNAIIVRELETAAGTSAQHRIVLFLQVKSFIERHIGEADLTPALIAAAHKISTRSVHKLFQRNGVTVASWIRQRRLERCRQDLVNPLYDHLTVSTIAARYAFTSDSYFNRAFRNTYGVPPSTYRRSRQAQRRKNGA